jgi:hypothetical protein
VAIFHASSDNPLSKVIAVNAITPKPRMQGPYPKFDQPWPRARKAVRHFARYAEACEAGEFSKAIPHRDELAKCGYEILFWPRRDPAAS